ALDLDEAEPAGAEGIHHVGGAEFRHLYAGLHRGAHDGGALGNGDLVPVDGERHHPFRAGGGSAEVDFWNEGHGNLRVNPLRRGWAATSLVSTTSSRRASPRRAHWHGHGRGRAFP